MAVGATAATATACLILLANIVKDKSHHTFEEAPVGFTSFFMAFGTICFGFGGHPAFPTFQADMINQRHFGRAVLFGYLSMETFSSMIEEKKMVRQKFHWAWIWSAYKMFFYCFCKLKPSTSRIWLMSPLSISKSCPKKQSVCYEVFSIFHSFCGISQIVKEQGFSFQNLSKHVVCITNLGSPEMYLRSAGLNVFQNVFRSICKSWKSYIFGDYVLRFLSFPLVIFSNF